MQEERAVGHLYRKGKSILCRYTNAGMTRNGKEVPKKSAYRYACSIHFDHMDKILNKLGLVKKLEPITQKNLKKKEARLGRFRPNMSP